MTRKIQSFFVLIMAAVLIAGCLPAQTKLSVADNGKTVTIQTGDRLVITLDGNPSTGYTWEAKDLDISMFEQVGEARFESSNSNLVGAGGTLTLTFKALKAGASALALVYHRPWETGVEPLEIFTVNVTVK